jgi:hypothetical protein
MAKAGEVMFKVLAVVGRMVGYKTFYPYNMSKQPNSQKQKPLLTV